MFSSALHNFTFTSGPETPSEKTRADPLCVRARATHTLSARVFVPNAWPSSL